MKTKLFLILLIILGYAHAYSQNSNLKATTKESDNAYEFSAEFDKNKHKDVVSYMDKVLGRENNISFANTRLDSKMTLDDKSTFYIKLLPGIVDIKFSKDDNTEANYRKLKKMCEGLSKIVH